MSKVVVLGAGMVGRAIAIDLSKKHEVVSADLNEEALHLLKPYKIATARADLSSPSEIKKVIAGG